MSKQPPALSRSLVPSPPLLRDQPKARTLQEKLAIRSLAAKTFLKWENLDTLFASGAARACGDFVIVRAVTQHDGLDEGGLQNGILASVSDVADVRKAQLFEIVDVGPTVPRNHLTKEDIGNFCISLATSLNPVNGAKASLYAVVRSDTISSAIDADLFVAQANHEQAMRAQTKAKANGLLD